MSEFIKVVVDAMGGDNAPESNIKGTIDAINEADNVKVILVGLEEEINKELAKYEYNKEQIEVVNATENISCNEPPVMAIRRKKDSSIVVGMKLVKEGKADAFLSAGSTGAVLVGGQLIVGRIKGIDRPPLAPVIPTKKGVSLLLDCGANVDARSNHLLQFAKMGTAYMEGVIGIDKPKVAIVNIGVEEEKGNMLVKETYPLLSNCPDINFVGSIEARDIPNGDVDIIVCEAFVGNVILKLYEGVASTLISEIKKGLTSTFKSKIGALLCKPALKETVKKFDVEKYGGAPMLGLNNLVVKTHGSSTANEIKNAIFQCIQFNEEDIQRKIQDKISNND
ncbi:MAG: phosphate acyltransferase PlsX [Lachnospiraceae bacterium]|nr:phosphate acyltransferase PlsX [Lachnospiraceae bacterium]